MGRRETTEIYTQEQILATMKDFVEAIGIMLDREIIKPGEAHDIYIKAIANWLSDEVHHTHEDELN